MLACLLAGRRLWFAFFEFLVGSFGDVYVVRDGGAVVLVCWPVQRFSAETFVVCMGTVWKLQTSRCPHRR